MQPPKISVLMPIYNADKYLEEAIQSILQQTFNNFEIIAIDDGSTDRSSKILSFFQNKDPRLKVIHQQNSGVTSASNKALSFANGEYIAHMDADDIALPDRFIKQIEFLESQPEYVAVGARVLLIDPEGMSICPFSTQQTHEEIDAAHMRVRGGAMCNPAVMLRRSVLLSLGGYREIMHPAQDIDLFLRLAEVGKLANLPETLLLYRMHPKSMGNSKRIAQKRAAIAAVRDAYYRRGLTPPGELDSNECNQASVSDLHRKWAWWALKAGNVATARKHAFLALKKSPFSTPNWRVMACAMRGY